MLSYDILGARCEKLVNNKRGDEIYIFAQVVAAAGAKNLKAYDVKTGEYID